MRRQLRNDVVKIDEVQVRVVALSIRDLRNPAARRCNSVSAIAQYDKQQ